MKLILAENMPCPFLARLTPGYVRNYGASLLINYRQLCPVVSKLSSSYVEAAFGEPVQEEKLEPNISKCPFLAQSPNAIKEASTAIQDDIIELSENKEPKDVFQYDEFFNEQIEKKKQDHSYR